MEDDMSQREVIEAATMLRAAPAGPARDRKFDELTAAVDRHFAALPKSDDVMVERIAKAFHEAYEDLAPLYEYRTRAETSKRWEDVPETNRRLMRSTVLALLNSEVIEPSDKILLTDRDAKVVLPALECLLDQQGVDQIARDRAVQLVERLTARLVPEQAIV